MILPLDTIKGARDSIIGGANHDNEVSGVGWSIYAFVNWVIVTRYTDLFSIYRHNSDISRILVGNIGNKIADHSDISAAPATSSFWT